MNKTIRTIAIVFLIVGALALIGGAIYGLAGKPGLGRGMPAADQQNFPQPGSERGSRAQRDGMQFFTRQGSFGLPLCLMGGGLTFLIAGAVLMIFNKKITSSIEVKEDKVEKADTAVKKTPQPKKTTSKKPASKA